MLQRLPSVLCTVHAPMQWLVVRGCLRYLSAHFLHFLSVVLPPRRPRCFLVPFLVLALVRLFWLRVLRWCLPRSPRITPRVAHFRWLEGFCFSDCCVSCSFS